MQLKITVQGLQKAKGTETTLFAFEKKEKLISDYRIVERELILNKNVEL